jgi:hypothetical protein
MFTIVVVLLQDEGELLKEVLGRNIHLNDMRQVFQMIFACWVWLKQRYEMGDGCVMMLWPTRVHT